MKLLDCLWSKVRNIGGRHWNDNLSGTAGQHRWVVWWRPFNASIVKFQWRFSSIHWNIVTENLCFNMFCNFFVEWINADENVDVHGKGNNHHYDRFHWPYLIDNCQNRVKNIVLFFIKCKYYEQKYGRDNKQWNKWDVEYQKSQVSRTFSNVYAKIEIKQTFI